MTVAVEGTIRPGYEDVAEAFAHAFDGRPSMGGALAVRLDGEWVADLWAGVADERTGAAWQRDTPSVIFSCTKGLVSLLAARLVEEGRLDYDAPVSRYWPEFAANGKAGVLVRHVLSHQAGLSAPDTDLTFEQIIDWGVVTAQLAAQAPLWPPGTGYAYHALTHGWLAGEMIRRVTGKSVGAYFAELVTAPLGVPAWIGIPPDVQGSVAHLQVAPDLAELWVQESAKITPDEPNWPYRAMTLGAALPPALVTAEGGFNDPRLRAAEVPGAGGIASAGALATIWSAAVVPTGGVRLLGPDIVRRATAVQTEGPPVFPAEEPFPRWGMGLQLDSGARRFLTGRSFGHDGAGGQVAFADPDHRVGFAFVTNWMEGPGDDRGTRIVDTLRGIVVR